MKMSTPSVQPNPHLSVAIPTYNRPAELAECLGSVMPQAKPLGIRIYVSDNASTGDAKSVVERFRAEYPYIFFRRNERNLGLDGNVRTVMAMAEGDYVWLFSDDDIIADGALVTLLKLCQSREYDLIIPDREYRDRSLSRTADSYRVNNVACPTEFTDPVALFERYGYSCYTYVGCLVVNAAAWRRVDPARYISCHWFEHLCVVAEMMVHRKALVLPDCSILVRGENATWTAQRWMVWGYHFPRALAALPDIYPGISRRKVLADMVNPSISNPARFIMTGRANGSINWSTAKMIVEPYIRLGATSWATLIWLSLLVPVPLMRLGKWLFGITKQV